MTIRETHSAQDVDVLVELEREDSPWTAINGAAWLHREASVPARAQLGAWVAELDGEVVGQSWAFKTWWMEGPASLNVSVLQREQGKGIGSALYEHALAYAEQLAPTRIMASSRRLAPSHSHGRAPSRRNAQNGSRLSIRGRSTPSRRHRCGPAPR